MLDGRLLCDLDAIEPLREEWDALAVSAADPYSAPGWMLAWWRAAAPQGARLRVAAALEGERLVGIAPFYAVRGFGGIEWLRLLAAPISLPTSPLAATGREREAARALAAALAGARPRPRVLAFDGIVEGSPWPDLLADEWPGKRPRLHTDHTLPAPTVALDAASPDDWLAAKSSNFRSQIRRSRRKLEKGGARFEMVGAEGDVAQALSDMGRLHHARWEDRGGSGVLDGPTERVLALAAEDLAPRGRLMLSTIQTEAGCISSHLAIAAGSEWAYWLGGHDDSWAAQKPGLQALVELVSAGLGHADEHGRLQLGPGDQEYKGRLADGEQALVFCTLAPGGSRSPWPRLALAAYELRRAIARRMPEHHRARLRALLRRP